MSCWRRWRGILTLLVSLLCSEARGATVTVFAAASLTDALKEIGLSHEKMSADKLVFNFGASNFLARQIREGATADIFFSADEAKMDGLEKEWMIDKATRRSLLSNKLVMIVAAQNGAALREPNDLLTDRIRTLVLAETRTVPAGIYARKYLEKLELWKKVEGKVIPTDSVRAALSAVEAGNADVGIVYKTDAAMSKKVRIAYEVPPESGPDISYSVAVLKDAPAAVQARRFLEYLHSDEARTVFERYGFIVRK